MKGAVQDRKIVIRRNHIHMVREDADTIRNLRDFHGGGTLQKIGEHALVRRIEVLDDDKRQAAVHRHVLQKLGQRLQAAGRGAQAHDRTHRLCVRLTRRRRGQHRLGRDRRSNATLPRR